MNMMYTVWQSKKKIHSYGQPKLVGHVPLLNSKVISMFLTLPNTSVQAEVIGERINRGGGFGKFQFYITFWPRKWRKLAQERTRGDLQKSRKGYKTLP